VQEAFILIGETGQQWQVTDISTETGTVAYSGLTSWTTTINENLSYLYNDLGNLLLVNAYYPVGATGQHWRSAAIFGNGAIAISGSSPLTSWTDAKYQHVVYIGVNGHLIEAYSPWQPSGAPWQFTDISGQLNVPGNVPVPGPFVGGPDLGGSALTSWVDAFFQHVAYIDDNGTVWEAVYPMADGQPVIGQHWQQPTNITSQAHAPVAASAPGSLGTGALTSWVDPSLQHVVYIDSNGHVRELYGPVGVAQSSWQVTDITQQTGVFASSSSPLTSWITG
jgi:hypothetical protein